jgi:hypothetical protein
MSQSVKGPAGDEAVSSELMLEIARRQIANTQAAAAEPGDCGRSLPLPMPDLASVSLGEAIRAAVFQLDALERRMGRRPADDASGEQDEAREKRVPAHVVDAMRRDR